MAKHKIHWRGPVTMVIGLISGFAFALGHHIFYHDLKGQRVDEAKHDQQMNVRIGTGLAFLVRAALVVSITVAYWQIFWRAILRQTIPLSTIDSMADLLSSLFSFFSVNALRVSPLLFLLAAVSWLVPLATVVPPATLTVSPIEVVSYEMHNLAAIDFENGPLPIVRTNFQAFGGKEQTGYNGATYPFKRLAMTTAMSNNIPSLPRPAKNSSYRLDFDAPGLKCEPTPIEILLEFDTAANGSYFKETIARPGYYASWDRSLIAWTPSETSNIPFEKDSLDGIIGQFQPLPFKNLSSPYVGAKEGEPATLYVAFDTEINGRTWSVVNCSLWNTSYTIDFEFRGNDQTISVKHTDHRHSVGLANWPDIHSDYGPEFFEKGSTLNYQAFMDGFGELIVGEFFIYADLGWLFSQGSLLLTQAAYTKELFPIYNRTISGKEMNKAIINDALHSNNFNKSLSVVLEEMFLNITVSLFSEPMFLGDNNLPTNVTVKMTYNVYEYSASRLLLSYGLAVGFTLLSVFFGFESIWSSRASYSNRFSTIIRTAYNESLTPHVDSMGRLPADPLPRELGKLKVQAGTGLVSPAASDIPPGAIAKKGGYVSVEARSDA